MTVVLASVSLLLPDTASGDNHSVGMLIRRACRRKLANGRFTLTKGAKEISQRWRVGQIEVEVKPQYNIAPTQNVLIVTDDGQRQLVQMRWGLIPSWADDPAIGARMINNSDPTQMNGWQSFVCLPLIRRRSLSGATSQSCNSADAS
jgi:hypothetical protein